jgi:hypothetical protein
MGKRHFLVKRFASLTGLINILDQFKERVFSPIFTGYPQVSSAAG